MKRQKGSILVAIVVIMPFFILIATAYMNMAISGYRIARKDQFRTHAQFAADAGVDSAMRSINQDDTWAGSGSEVELHNDGKIRTTFQTTVTSIDDDHKTIFATGRTYNPATSTTAASRVKIEVGLRPVRSGDFSIVTGVGGLFMSNQAKVLGGNVFVNGELVMTGSSQIGLTTNSVTLKVAHQNCPNPPNSTYPRICNPGENGQPISVSNPAWIYGDVSANNQTNGDRMSESGLVASSGVPTQALPSHDRAAQKAAITTNRTGADASCTTNNGTKTWEANTKITGNVQIDKDCTVTIKGNVWITGNFQMSHSKAKLKVSDLVGTTRPDLMIDGHITSLRNGSSIISNASNTGVRLLSYWTTASCYPDCSDVTGTELYNSRNDVAITFDQTSNGPTSIFYARWGKVLIENSGSIGALVGQTIELQNSGTITFGTSAGVSQTFWVIDGYRRDF